ncbi:MAG TPA: peroxiredoxin family protein [Patescibacteria group bacterium]|nr:peroxiredoxin family protein [Patescibacteria group bacterium]
MISVGFSAPDFVLKDSENKDFVLSALRGKFVLLLFYPYDHGFFCTRQFCEYRDDWQEFKERNIVVMGINSGSPESHKDFKDKYLLPFPLLSDSDSAVSKKYGAYYPLAGISMRAYVLISPEGKILYAKSELFPVLKKSLKDLIAIVDKCMLAFKNAA